MNLRKSLQIFFLFFSVCHCYTETYLESCLGDYRAFRDMLNRIDEKEVRSGNPGKFFRIQQRVSDDVPFPCSLENPRSNVTPTDVNKLKPGDIDVIGAVGDSLTAGFGATATNIIDIFVESRGMAFTIGGQGTWRDYLTLPNILKQYNPKLVGYSLAPSITTDRKSQFNVAEVGAISSDVPHETQLLITRILRDPRVDLDNHWKFITIFIGSNDFCNEICYYRNPEDILESHRNDLVTSLRILRDNLPRTFVSIVLPPDISVLRGFTHPTKTCWSIQRILCPCFIGEHFKQRHSYLRSIMERFREIDIEVANYDEFDTENFTVVLQPMFLHTTLPSTSDGETDKSFFSIDCFHFSQKGHALVAKAYWNNVIEPVGQKTRHYIVDEFKCPTKNKPYLATRKNSL